MKIKDERAKLEELLNQSANRINDNVPTPGNIPEELQSEPIINVDFAELRIKCEKEAKTMLTNSIQFILSASEIKGNKYLVGKLKVDIMSLSGMIYQLRVTELAQLAQLNEMNRGNLHHRVIDSFSSLSKIIAENNKQLLGTVEAIKSTYKDIKQDIREKQTESLPSPQDTAGMLAQGDGGVISFGTKELINNVKRQAKENNQFIEDAKIISADEEFNKIIEEQ